MRIWILILGSKGVKQNVLGRLSKVTLLCQLKIIVYTITQVFFFFYSTSASRQINFHEKVMFEVDIVYLINLEIGSAPATLRTDNTCTVGPV